MSYRDELVAVLARWAYWAKVEYQCSKLKVAGLSPAEVHFVSPTPPNTAD